MVRVCHEPRIRMNPVLSVHPRCKKSNSSLPASKAYMSDHHATLLQWRLTHRLMEDCWTKVSVSWLLTLWSSLYLAKEDDLATSERVRKVLWVTGIKPCGRTSARENQRMLPGGESSSKRPKTDLQRGQWSFRVPHLSLARPCLTISEKSKSTEDVYSSLYKKIEMPWHLTAHIWKKLNRFSQIWQ